MKIFRHQVNQETSPKSISKWSTQDNSSTDMVRHRSQTYCRTNGNLLHWVISWESVEFKKRSFQPWPKTLSAGWSNQTAIQAANGKQSDSLDVNLYSKTSCIIFRRNQYQCTDTVAFSIYFTLFWFIFYHNAAFSCKSYWNFLHI